MKRIVLFITSLSIGGAERQICALADGLANKGYNITIVTYSDVSDFYSYNSLVHRYRIAPGKSKFIKSLAIWRYFLTLKADWVIAFTQRACCFCLRPLWIRSKNKIRVIASERNTTIGKPGRQELELMRFLYRRVDFIVPNSNTQREHIIQENPRYKDKTITITNYTDTNNYCPTMLPGREVLQIGVFSRYSEQKNCIRFVEVIRKLKEMTKQKFIIEWYGDRYIKDTLLNPMYESMSKKIEEYGLSDCVILNDMTHDVAGEMAKFDAFCLPSLYEGFSNSISEAICCGKPCLVSDVSDNGVMVKNAINGFLFDPKSEESMVLAFRAFFKLSNEERQIMGNESRKLAEALFNYDAFIQKYINLIES